jgi:hypothetical protein
MVAVFLILKGKTGALAPLSYIVNSIITVATLISEAFNR